MQDSMIYLSNPASDGTNDMPRRDMNAGSTTVDGMPGAVDGMPTGSMTDGPANPGGQPPATGEMPTGAMTDGSATPAGSSNRMPGATGEMPTGSMNPNPAGANSTDAGAPVNAFELSGTWKLQLTTHQITAK